MSGSVECLKSDRAPRPLGPYSHAVAAGPFLHLCGMGPRDPKTNGVPGLRLDAEGRRLGYDIAAETRAVLENIRICLDDFGSSLDSIVEITVYLVDMADFQKMNAVWLEYFSEHQPARTTVAVTALPGSISVEMKAVAWRDARSDT